MLAFPSEAGWAGQLAEHGLIEAVGGLIDDGRVSVFAVDTIDGQTWSDTWQPTEERARRHRAYQGWLIEQVVPWICAESGWGGELIATGVSMGAYHAVNLTLQRPDLAPLAIGLSGNYDVTTWNGWGDLGEAAYFANPVAYVGGMQGDHLDWVRSLASVLLVVGQGAFEVSPTQALPQTVRLAGLLEAKGIRHELDVWGGDSAHDWPWWAKQLAHHLPRFVS